MIPGKATTARHRRSVTGTPFSSTEARLNQDVEKLWELQTVLSALGEREKQLNSKPESFAAVDRQWQGANVEMEKQQQYAAAWKEIDATRKHVKELEDSELKTMTDIEGLQKQLDDRGADSTTLKEQWDVEHEKWQQSLGSLRADAEALRKRAQTIEESLPERVR